MCWPGTSSTNTAPTPDEFRTAPAASDPLAPDWLGITLASRNTARTHQWARPVIRRTGIKNRNTFGSKNMDPPLLGERYGDRVCFLPAPAGAGTLSYPPATLPRSLSAMPRRLLAAILFGLWT